MSDDTPYDDLTPDVILDALEAHGFEPTGSLVALNSYENRVYQLGIEGDEFVVVKFYRPNRWNRAQIVEEHAFIDELVSAELPCVAPFRIDGDTAPTYKGYTLAVFPRQGGHQPNLEVEEDLKVLARTLGRMHAIGAVRPFEHRTTLSVERMGHESRRYLLGSGFIPLELEEAYASVTEHLLERMPDIDAVPSIRVHGDCHMGNLLWRGDTPHFVDFDDCVNGPAIQDLWMLLSGERDARQHQLGLIAEAYDQFADFPTHSLKLIEGLRTLRMMHHAAWIARRWSDPAFPVAFPWFDGGRYWSDHVLELREQLAAIDELPLSI